MDVAADRFIALSPISAIIWSTFEPHTDDEHVIRAICSSKHVCRGEATALLQVQIDKWFAAGLLIAQDQAVKDVPSARPAETKSRTEIARNDLDIARISMGLCLKLAFAESDYRRRIRKDGLARALVRLQSERCRSTPREWRFLLCVLKSYYFSRRAFKQGGGRDCLFRSIGLSAVLRRHGFENELCIGITGLPFTSHAWVEHQGYVVNETLDNANGYVVIGRF